ncbi:MAG: CCA tRNA nucleotidyltransferase [Solirubrobacterales bacterium]
MTDQHPDESLAQTVQTAYPELREVLVRATDPVYLVGGAVRDLLLGRDRSDLDIVVVGDAGALARALGVEVLEHERFATAKVRLDGHVVDVASARTESYPRPGALPEVTPAEDIEADLARRDFTVNAMAYSLDGNGLIDPFGGCSDLDAGLMRVLHTRSFIDDPTRALRAARYAARFGFALEPGTEELLRAADLKTLSAERREAELLRLAGEDTASRGFGLLVEWGLLKPRRGGLELARRVRQLLSSPPWLDAAPRDRAILDAVLGPPRGEIELFSSAPETPSRAVELAGRHDPVELVLARALGAEWLDRYVAEWREVALEIDGVDLVEAGIAEGPAVGRGLGAALRLKLDGEIIGREAELEAALRIARGDNAVE